MKKFIYALTLVSLILFPLSTAHAALTKAVEAIDAWAEVAQGAGGVREGTTVAVDPNYQTTLHIDVCLSEAVAETAGATIFVEISSNTTGDADWDTMTDLHSRLNPPQIKGAIKNSSSSLEGWTTSLTKGSYIQATVVSCNSVTQSSVVLILTKT